MRILLDECLPKKLKREIIGHIVWTVQDRRWSGIKNGNLLKLAEAEFDVFISVDQNINYQQDLPKLKLAVITLSANDNRIESLRPLLPKLLEVLLVINDGEYVRIAIKNEG